MNFHQAVKDKDYNIDVFKIPELTGESPLLWIGKVVIKYHNIGESFNISDDTITSFLKKVEAVYHPNNPYHNNFHAADVTWNLHHLLCKSGLDSILTKLELFACIFSAIIHDCDHPGCNNNFLIATNHPLAITHNDISPLENHHCSTGFKIARESNIFKDMSSTDYKTFRNLVINFVLGTDFGKSNEIVKRIKEATEEGGWSTKKAECRKDLGLLCLKCADVGHVTKSVELHKIWTMRITEEFFNQGDKERELNIPVSAGMDRNTVDLSSSQCFFIGNIVLPMVELFVNVLPNCNDRVIQGKRNMDFWKEGNI